MGLGYIDANKKSNTIRISWDNDNRVTSSSPFEKATYKNEQQGKSTAFTITVIGTMQTKANRGFDFMDAFVILLILSLATSISFFIHYCATRRQRARRRLEAISLEMRSPINYPSPILYTYTLDLNRQTQANAPISMENFKGPWASELIGFSYVILMPGVQECLCQGDLPHFGIGTRIVRGHMVRAQEK